MNIKSLFMALLLFIAVINSNIYAVEIDKELNWLSDESQQVILNSCYDCHSDYGKTKTGVSAKELRKGKKKLNFSNWYKLDISKQADEFYESLEAIRDGEMPTEDYLDEFPNRNVSNAQFQQLIKEYNAWQP